MAVGIGVGLAQAVNIKMAGKNKKRIGFITCSLTFCWVDWGNYRSPTIYKHPSKEGYFFNGPPLIFLAPRTAQGAKKQKSQRA
jgi:hypothetical protein